MGLKIGLTFNIKSEYMPGPTDPPDLNAEFDHEKTLVDIETSLQKFGHEVVRIGNASKLLGQWGKLGVDIVFNIAEGYEGRNRESQVPLLLEMMRMPYVGSDALTLGLTLDKILTKKVLIAEGIPTPGFKEVSSAEDAMRCHLKFPVIVKLRYEGSSKGLSDRSLVDSEEAMYEQIEWLNKHYNNPPIILEEFIEGREYTVPIIGNFGANVSPRVYPVVQTTLDGNTDLGRKFYTFDYITQGAAYLCPAQLDDEMARRLQDLALKTYRAVDCLDFGRVDFRLDYNNNPYVLEINPLPSLSILDVYKFVADVEGAEFADMIDRILHAALNRTGVSVREGERSLN